MLGPSVPGPPTGIPVPDDWTEKEWTQALAAALAAGLDRKYYYAARIRWTMDRTCCHEVEQLLWLDLRETATKRKWIMAVGQKTLRMLSELAVAEMLEPAVYGHEPQRIKYFASRVKLPQERILPSWEKVWRGRYQEFAWAPLERWTEVAASHIDWRQQGEDDAS